MKHRYHILFRVLCKPIRYQIYFDINDSTFNNVHLKHVNEQIECFNEDSVAKFDPVLDMPVVMSEVIAACKSLKNGKAAGHDLVTNEHLKYGGEALYRHLATLFNVMLRCSHVPAEVKKVSL